MPTYAQGAELQFHFPMIASSAVGGTAHETTLATGAPVVWYAGTNDNGDAITSGSPAFTPVQVTSGLWRVVLSAAEMNYKTVSVQITMTTAMTVFRTFHTVVVQPRINYPAGRSYQLKANNRHDGTFKANNPIRLRPGATSVAVSVDLASQFGNEFVNIVGPPTLANLSSLTATALGPRDTAAMVQLGGTATAGDTGTVEFLATMKTGDTALVTFDVKVFDT